MKFFSLRDIATVSFEVVVVHYDDMEVKTTVDKEYCVTGQPGSTVSATLNGKVYQLCLVPASGQTSFKAISDSVETSEDVIIRPFSAASAAGGIGGGGNAGGERGPQGPAGKDGKDGTMVQQCIHVSFDDVKDVTAALAAGTLASVWDNAFLAALKDAHDKYGMTFSLYLYAVPSPVPTKYQAELAAAAKWLKWGLHGWGGDYSEASYTKGQSDWNTMVSAVLAMTGTQEAVDRMPRLHMFAGTREALRGMRDANLGALGFLTADDARDSYYLDAQRRDWLYSGENDHLIDFEEGLIFYRTDLRLDWFSGMGFSTSASASAAHLPVYSGSVKNELLLRYEASEFVNTWPSFEIFVHEWQPLASVRAALSDIGEFAKEKSVAFGFPQNRVCELTAYDVHPVGESGSGESDSVDEYTAVCLFDDINAISDDTDHFKHENVVLYLPSMGKNNSMATSYSNSIIKNLTVYSPKGVNIRNTLQKLEMHVQEVSTAEGVSYICRENYSLYQELRAPQATSLTDALGYYQVGNASVRRVKLYAPKATSLADIGRNAPYLSDADIDCRSLSSNVNNLFPKSPLSKTSVLTFLSRLPVLANGTSYTIALGCDAALENDAAFLAEVSSYYNAETATGWDIGLNFNALN